MMFSPRTLQTKLLVSVFFIVIFTVTTMTALVIYIEKRQNQENELERIFYKTEAMNKRLGHLMYSRNWRFVMMTLSNAKKADPSMVFFTITGTDGKVLISDDETLVGSNTYNTTRIIDPDQPLVLKEGEKNNHNGSDRFAIFLSQYLAELDSSPRSPSSHEIIFEAVYDISYLGDALGTLRVGFTREDMRNRLLFLTSGMLGTGMLVLIAILVMIFLVIRNHMIPMDSFVRHISGVDLNRSGKSLKDSLADVSLEAKSGETKDVRQLKQAFNHIRGQFFLAWDQLEQHRNNLEQMVEERTQALNQSNEQLSLQIKERKEIEARILTVQKLEAIGTLAGGIAHEFNNLFMAITGYSTLIQKKAEPGHPNIEKAEKIRQLVETGSQSVQQLLGFARSGKYEPGPLNLNEVLKLNLVILSSSKKGLTVDTDYSKNLWTVYADRSQLEQVAMNLMLNAVEAMSGKGRIRVKTQNLELQGFQVSLEKKVSGRFVMFSVDDSGIGIHPDVLPRIFDPFYTTKEMGKGSGMGLASVFGIIENHGGFTMVESELEKGSTFSVYLPVLAEDTL